jgi:purine-binding chemotaxis protein CheW
VAEREVLLERARALSVPTAAPRADERGLELVLFALAEETYGIESRFVVEVLRGADVALLPGARPPVAGISAWRGELLPVLDLSLLLGAAPGAEGQAACTVVLGDPHRPFGILVDEVRGVREIEGSDVHPLPRAGGAGRDLLMGTTSDALLVLAGEDLIQIPF